MKAKALYTIALARVEMTGLRETDKLHRPDGVNWRPVMIPVPESAALVWRLAGDQSDLEKAKAFAETEGYSVFTFPTNERDPIGKAKSLAMLDYYEKVQEHMQT